MLAIQLTAPYRLVHPATAHSMLVCKEAAAPVWSAIDISLVQSGDYGAQHRQLI